MKRQIVKFKAPYYGAVGVMQEKLKCKLNEVRKLPNGKLPFVASEYYCDASTNPPTPIKLLRQAKFSSFDEANGKCKVWIDEDKRRQDEIRRVCVKGIAEPFAKPPPEILDPTDPQLIAGASDRRDAEKIRQKFLRDKWPRTFKKTDEKAAAADIEKAYLLDVAEFSGMKAFPIDDHREIAKQISVALYNYSRRTKKMSAMIIDEAIMFHWPKLVYLDNKQFADAVKKLTGISVTPSQAKQRRVRLGLSSRCPAGRRRSC